MPEHSWKWARPGTLKRGWEYEDADLETLLHQRGTHR